MRRKLHPQGDTGSVPRSCVEGFEHGFGVAFDDAEEGAGGAIGAAEALFPVLQSADADADEGGGLALREAEIIARRCEVLLAQRAGRNTRRRKSSSMQKPKKKLTAAQRKAKKLRKQMFETVFMNGKQVRVRRPPAIDGMNAEEFMRRNADPLWLHQNEMWENLPKAGGDRAGTGGNGAGTGGGDDAHDNDGLIPF